MDWLEVCMLDSNGISGVLGCCAALTKVLLSFEHRLLPANLHFQEPNPKSEGLKEGFLKVSNAAAAVLHLRCCI